jgi:hypothetical protein
MNISERRGNVRRVVRAENDPGESNLFKSGLARLGIIFFAASAIASVAYGNGAPILKTIDFPNAIYTAVSGLSETLVVGEADDAGGGIHGFVLDRGNFTQFDAPAPAFITILNGVNDRGQLSGSYLDGAAHGFFWSRGAFTILTPPNTINTQAGQINNREQVAGFFRDTNRKRHGFVWDKGSFQIFNVPNDHVTGGTLGWGINNKGDMVGSFIDSSVNRHGFLLRKGVFTVIDPPGSLDTLAWSINDDGVIVGQYFTDAVHGFILKDGVYTTLDIPNGLNASPNTINNEGYIGGSYDDPTGATHGFITKMGSLDVETRRGNGRASGIGATIIKRERFGRQ